MTFIYPKILAIDTSTDACSAALLVDHKINDQFIVAPKQHTKLILSMINELLNEAQLELNQLDAIAFGSGPGSFTGVRLATSIVQGFAFAANLPVIKISTLRILAQEVFIEFKAPKVLVAQDARMQEVYFGEYGVDNKGIMQEIKPDSLIKPENITKICADGFIGVGSGFEVYRDIFSQRCNIKIIDRKYAQAKYMLQLAEFEFAKGNMVSAKEALPTYLREKVVQ
ncbi:MAG: Peptidase M22, glycoprotease [uncultured bacterium]|nr:MAG: Peptidase M22, glycoprotease [uncultured bacterium]OGT09712.1 MAG: tRNA (adenosine(37)-N6)-threonylcarbamoyltransferase complex dimerization subunit type 1 TsaB [Gammaproteobacteria bacterium RBG_16_37_9]HBC71244.1 tRNA (adenosine(37)-N6)-threonylcarbamoyltransferase complex dimerization subunit type 1 TsaB [Coxiellaceae bacterium]HBS52166.1 tRNA (adenosine(37)-N6)-threonylcarbamoyltransferase complex dimerization subunit type 1 TsaB [Coxiellaceae bacterium]HBY55617.1 tRNA (adenosine(37